jgi:hypothetical protein
MKALKEWFAKFVMELLIVVVGAVAAILWAFNGNISALESGRQSNKENIELLRDTIESFRKENREDHKEIMREIKKDARP